MSLLIPALVAVAVAVLAGLVPLPLRPSVATPVLTLLAAMAAGITLAVLVAVSAIFAAGPAVLGAIAQWCPSISFHHRVSWPLGVGAIATLAAVLWRTRTVLERHRLSGCATHGRRLAVLYVDEPIAFAAPGSPGCVVVSSGLLEALEPRERQVVFAHERAHLDQRHYQHLLVVAVATAILPLLAPLARRLRHATERCADEAAVTAMGGDRQLVARAIARAALAKTSHRGLVAPFGGGSVPGRIGALLGAQIGRSSVAVGLALATVAAGLILAASAVQLLQVAEFVAHVCGR